MFEIKFRENEDTNISRKIFSIWPFWMNVCPEAILWGYKKCSLFQWQWVIFHFQFLFELAHYTCTRVKAHPITHTQITKNQAGTSLGFLLDPCYILLSSNLYHTSPFQDYCQKQKLSLFMSMLQFQNLGARTEGTWPILAGKIKKEAKVCMRTQLRPSCFWPVLFTSYLISLSKSGVYQSTHFYFQFWFS